MLAEQKKRGQMTRQEAGRKGGEKVAREREAPNSIERLVRRAVRKSRRSEVQNSTGKLAEKAEKAEETEVAILELKSQLARI
jgi:hypothetical protein